MDPLLPRQPESHGRAPAPRAQRALFALFRFYREETGLDGLIDNIDLTGVLPRQVYHVVHDRPPDSIETALGERDYAIEVLLAAALRSEEFRRKLPRALLRAYPDKHRLFFVHIPKCAGSNLTAHLSGRFASLNTALLDPAAVPDEKLFLALKHFALETEVSDTIYVHGHNHLQTYEDWEGPRLDDTVITVLRDPVAMVVSQINYVLTRILSREDPPSHDTLGWRRVFDVTTRDGAVPGKREVLALAGRILRDRDVVPDNIMTQFLGDRRCDIAAERIVTRNVEVTDMTRYQAWCRERWGIESGKRLNPSERHVTWDELTPADRDVVAGITTEDTKLYRMVSARLTALGRNCLVGRELVS